jgi:hypothetical protein
VLDHQACRFGNWLEGEARERYGQRHRLRTIESLHRRVHGLALELIDLRAMGKQREALERLPELHRVRDGLLDQLNLLME